MPLTPDEQAEVIARIERDPVVKSADNLRRALRQLIDWPFSRKRRRSFLGAMEDDHELLVNRLMVTAGSTVVGPLEDIRAEQARHRKDMKALSTQMGRLTKQLDDMRAELDTLYRERALRLHSEDVATWIDDGLAAREQAVGAVQD